MSVSAFLMFAVAAALFTWVSDAMLPTPVPGGVWLFELVGIIGAALGSTLFGTFGLTIDKVALMPAFMGSALLVFSLALLARVAASASAEKLGKYGKYRHS